MGGVDFWGEAVPAWISALGGVAAAGIGAAAFVLSLRNAGGVRTLRAAANTPTQPVSTGDESRHLAGQDPPAPAVSPVTWTAWREQRNSYRLRNDSTNTNATARLTAFEDVTPGGDGAAFYSGPMPVELKANESVPFTVDRSFVSPSVTAIRLAWEDPDGTERERTLYI